MSIRISFVVPVRNDAVRLETCLRAIRAAHGATDQVEVIVVDNGSTDRSPEVARAHGARVLAIEQVRVSELRNRGAAEAAGDVLAFVDADNEIVAGWVGVAVGNLKHKTIGATGALYSAPSDGTWVQRGYGLLRGRMLKRRDVDWLGSGNLAVRRDVFQAVGGFDTSLEACEDVDLCHRIVASGFRILGDPRLDSIHHGDPATVRALFRSELWRGRDNLRVSFRRPIAWASIPSAVVPIIDAALLGGAAVGLVGWMAGWTRGLVATSAALAILAGWAFLRVLRAATRDRSVQGAVVIEALVVALVYDVARAIALFARAPHRSVRSNPATTTAT